MLYLSYLPAEVIGQYVRPSLFAQQYTGHIELIKDGWLPEDPAVMIMHAGDVPRLLSGHRRAVSARIKQPDLLVPTLISIKRLTLKEIINYARSQQIITSNATLPDVRSASRTC